MTEFLEYFYVCSKIFIRTAFAGTHDDSKLTTDICYSPKYRRCVGSQELLMDL